MGCYLLIKQNFDNYTSSETKIAEYILKNPKELYKLSALELAHLTDTSSASIIRFSKKLGFEGFQELKLELAKEESDHKNTNNQYGYINTEDSIKDIMLKVGNKNIDAIKDTLDLLDISELEAAVTSIINAKNIYIFGIGVSALIALDLQYKLMRINKNTFMYLDSHMQLSSASNIDSKDIAIAISYSGRTKEVYKCISKAKANGAKCISITKYGRNPISESSHIKLQVPNMEEGIRVGAISSRIGQLTLIDILFIGVAKNNFSQVENCLKETSQIVEDFKVK